MVTITKLLDYVHYRYLYFFKDITICVTLLCYYRVKVVFFVQCLIKCVFSTLFLQSRVLDILLVQLLGCFSKHDGNLFKTHIQTASETSQLLVTASGQLLGSLLKYQWKR